MLEVTPLGVFVGRVDTQALLASPHRGGNWPALDYENIKMYVRSILNYFGGCNLIESIRSSIITRSSLVVLYER